MAKKEKLDIKTEKIVIREEPEKEDVGIKAEKVIIEVGKEEEPKKKKRKKPKKIKPKKEGVKIDMGKILGLVIFFIGIGLLLCVFFLAISLFTNPAGFSGFTSLFSIQDPNIQVILSFVGLVLLWILAFVGGKIGSLGKNMFLKKQ